MTPDENPDHRTPIRPEGAPGIERTTVVAYGDGVDGSGLTRTYERLAGWLGDLSAGQLGLLSAAITSEAKRRTTRTR